MDGFKHISFLAGFFVFLLYLGVGPSISYSQQLPDEKLLKDVNTEEIIEIIDSYEGKKAVLVNIWATWCGPCIEEFPHIVKLQNRYKERLRVVFISTDFRREPAIEFLREQNVDWTTYYSTVNNEHFINSISEKWSGAMPFTKILDKDGNVVSSWENSADFDRFETEINKAINQE